jgi:hypothetical protein
MSKTKNIPKECPSCGGNLSIIELQCENCNTVIKGKYVIPKLIRLQEDEMEFLISFLSSRGNIKEIEKELKISYPTVKAKLDNLLMSLGIKNRIETTTDFKKSILDSIEKGEMKVEEAVKIFKSKLNNYSFEEDNNE